MKHDEVYTMKIRGGKTIVNSVTRKVDIGFEGEKYSVK
jgi:hypothetical protein